jgi:carbamoyltransferase
MYILGLSCFYHDSAACLLRDGFIVAAASEERFTRKKHDFRFPRNAVAYVLEEAGITIDQVDYVAFYDKPFVKFERILQTYMSVAPRGIRSFIKAVPLWMRQKLWMRSVIHKELGYNGPILFSDHHLSHAASSFLFSPFREAAILTVDGVGEWTTTAKGVGKDRTIELSHEIRFPHSLGLVYSAFTGYLGFKVNSGEYKVMGLAPYGEPKYYDKIMDELLDVREDGSFKLNMRYFAYTYGLTMVNKRFERLFGVPPRKPETKIEPVHFDIAQSIQKVTETIMLRMARSLRKETGQRYLCLAGGVALNCVANGLILREAGYDDIFIQPAAGDAGGALGAALLVHHVVLDNPRDGERQKMPYFGPSYSEEEIKAVLDRFGAVYHRLDREALVRKTAQLIVEKNVLGWFQGRMEFGPRALGSRSILADARDPEMRDTVNLKIKFRESFRPFAPTVLAEEVSEWFEIDRESPYMLLVAQVREDRRQVPAITHVDGSARIQTIAREDNPLYYDVIKAYADLTGVPIIINTSFNVRGEPIVCSPEHAYLCFMRTHMDQLIAGPFWLDKKEQKELVEETDWRASLVLD